MDVKQFVHNGIKIVFAVLDTGMVKLVYLGKDKDVPIMAPEVYKWHRPVEIHLSGGNHNDHHFNKLTGSSEAFTLAYESLTEQNTGNGKEVVLSQSNGNVRVKTHYVFFGPVPCVRVFSEVTNVSGGPVALEYVSSFSLVGLLPETGDDWTQNLDVTLAHNYWQGECVWKTYSLHELGLYNVQAFSGKRVSVSSNGGWSTGEYLPMGILSNRLSKEKVVWQIEHNGGWHFEISSIGSKPYVMLCGPTASENSWCKELLPGETFVSVPCAVSFGGSADELFGNLTAYRRLIRRKSDDNERLNVVFNDYMNCLFGNPTTETEIPMIDKASDAGCEIYCIDCGWYDDGDWWAAVGEWKEAETRFHGRLNELTEYIRQKGMTPGLWLEIEVMGIDCALAKTMPDECFFMRNGKRVIDHSRYHLDFTHPQVREFATSVVERLIADFGVGYIKMDYNINSGLGTEVNSFSLGDGLMKHNRAYLAWVGAMLDKHPGLIIENCASGGLRMDYASLAVHSIQSTSDQVDYRKYAAIAANYATAVTPEQGAVWSYPLEGGDTEETVFNMVNCMLGRVHQSGHLQNLSAERFSLVKEGLAVYKGLRASISRGLPVFLSGLGYYDEKWLAFGITDGDVMYAAVWNLDNTDEIAVTLPQSALSAQQIYPGGIPLKMRVDENKLTVTPTQKYQARLYKVQFAPKTIGE